MSPKSAGPMTQIFEDLESNVRSYCRSCPVVFTRAKGSLLYDRDGQEYVDFFSGAGALNYGHNNEHLKKRVVDYLLGDGVMHALDLYTEAKRSFLEALASRVLAPRGLDFRVQFCGPTGTNAIEAALKLARKVKGRSGIFSFMGGYHGVSLGSLAASGNRWMRRAAGTSLGDVTFMPYPHGFMSSFDSIGYIDAVLDDSHSGVDLPAAILVETVQCEGGVVVAPTGWLRRLRDLCDRRDILLICDDIQAGCGRTGPFFSFEHAGIEPDMVTLSKSLSGYGFPLSVLLLGRNLDLWQPGEHSGTFRGNQLAFVAATAALELRDEIGLEEQTAASGDLMADWLAEKAAGWGAEVRGLGMLWGLDFSHAGGAERTGEIVRCCARNGLVIERCGRHDAVLKLLPPLTTSRELLERGCRILEQSVAEVEADRAGPLAAAVAG